MFFLLSLLWIFSQTYSTIYSFIASYGLLAIAALMLLEAMSLPVPSEAVLPLAGYFSSPAVHAMNLFAALLVIELSSFVGMAIDYYIAYFIGKDVVYKHLGIFRIKKENLDEFDAWFEKNGLFTVFIARFIPVVRGLINFPAGFALMDQKKFYAYSMLSATIWNIILIFFGYYALGEAKSVAELMIIIGVFVAALYTIYLFAMRQIRKRK